MRLMKRWSRPQSLVKSQACFCEAGRKNQRIMLVHSVFFWSKPGLSADEQTAWLAGLESLKQIPTVSSVYIGRPASTPARAVTEKSFALALTIVFKDAAAHDAYQDHPIHLDFVKNCQKYWSKVQVFDAE